MGSPEIIIANRVCVAAALNATRSGTIDGVGAILPGGTN